MDSVGAQPYEEFIVEKSARQLIFGAFLLQTLQNRTSERKFELCGAKYKKSTPVRGS